MNDQELCQLLEKLQSEIEATKTVDEKERELLQDLETDIHERRPAYRRYIETTPAFFPWKPRRAIPQPHLGEGRQ